jgi:hypothetical protein
MAIAKAGEEGACDADEANEARAAANSSWHNELDLTASFTQAFLPLPRRSIAASS